MGIVVHNRYFALAGNESVALAVRRQASSVRRTAGRPTGKILIPSRGEDNELTFIWECDYESLEARDTDAAWAAASIEFEAVRQRMTPLLARFERVLFHVDAEDSR
jgi:hypothetical protein